MIEALLVGDTLRAPSVGWFRRTVLVDHLIVPGDTIGELDVLGRIVRVVAPRVRGIVQLDDPSEHRAVGYGDVLVRLAAEVATALAAPAIDAAKTAEQNVFRAPTSGRYYGRPSPDKPAFVEVGAELAAGATVCLLEVMKTFHRVTFAGAPARVRAVLVADGADVTAGEPLLALDPV